MQLRSHSAAAAMEGSPMGRADVVYRSGTAAKRRRPVGSFMLSGVAEVLLIAARLDWMWLDVLKCFVR